MEFVSNGDGTITIPESVFEELLKAEAKLIALEGAGVDNWDGYDYAMESLDED